MSEGDDNPYAAPQTNAAMQQPRAVSAIEEVAKTLRWIGKIATLLYISYGVAFLIFLILGQIIVAGGPPSEFIYTIGLSALLFFFVSRSFLRTSKALLAKRRWAYVNAIACSSLLLLFFPILTIPGIISLYKLIKYYRAYCALDDDTVEKA